MRLIKQLSDDMRCNIHEAREKIDTAYDLKEENKQAADWYKTMALAHLDFNTAGHAAIRKLIDEYNASGKQSDLTPGMKAVYGSVHADIMREAAEVRYLIERYDK